MESLLSLARVSSYSNYSKDLRRSSPVTVALYSKSPTLQLVCTMWWVRTYRTKIIKLFYYARNSRYKRIPEATIVISDYIIRTRTVKSHRDEVRDIVRETINHPDDAFTRQPSSVLLIARSTEFPRLFARNHNRGVATRRFCEISHRISNANALCVQGGGIRGSRWFRTALSSKWSRLFCRRRSLSHSFFLVEIDVLIMIRLIDFKIHRSSKWFVYDFWKC